MASATSVGELLDAAANGDARAWDAIVDRYAALVWSVCRRHRLSETDAADVSQTVWLRLVETLGRIREPDALAGWIATTARRECLRVLGAAARQIPTDTVTGWDVPDQRDNAAVDFDLLRAEQAAAVRAAFAELPAHCREMLAMLVADPPSSYAEVSRRLDIPVGSIGPTRGRCLDRLRRCPALARLEEQLTTNLGDERNGVLAR